MMETTEPVSERSQNADKGSARKARFSPPAAEGSEATTTHGSQVSRMAGDQFNRFLLCSLVTESSKRIKARANQAGEHLSMTNIVPGVLRAYRFEAQERDGLLSKSETESEVNIDNLKRLNDKILKQELARHIRASVKSGEGRLARATRLGDETRIRAEKEALDLTLAARNYLGRAI